MSPIRHSGRRSSIRALLLLGSSLASTPVLGQTPTADQPPAETAAPPENVQDIVVTGTTSRNRPLITASADITLADRAAIDRRAPRSTADLLELVPGIFVEGTAGGLSNNYSVRGLQGGGQRFIQLEEDGMPIIYQGGGADFFFSQDLTIDRLEAVKGGSSGVLTVNGAGATINFLSKRPNFEEAEGIARASAYDFGLLRGDLYYSAPITDKLAFSIGGYFQSSPGVRDNPFSYEGYRVKGALEYRFDDGGFVRLSGKYGDIKEAYYAGMPYAYNDGKPSAVTGLDPQRDNIGGDSFSRISIPVSTFVDPDGFRDFRYTEGVRVKTKQIRLDFEKPVSESLSVFGRGRYLDLSYDFNGLFPGSGTGNAGLASAVDYLTPGTSPINGLLTAGRAAFPTATRFGIRNLTTGVVTGSNQTAALNGLNGNGFLQQTTLNHDYQEGHDFGMNLGARWEVESGSIKNSLTFGILYYDVRRYQDQSATATALNDVKNNSDLYDVVALDANNAVIGTLTDNGLVSYGNWGAGIRERSDESISLYVNDEIAIGDKLRVDAGIRWENLDSRYDEGNAAAINQPVPAGVGGVVRDVGSTFDGTFRTVTDKKDAIAWTIGANYLFTDNFSIYARYADGFQTNNTDPITKIELYEVGARVQFGRIFSGSVTAFQTNFNDQFYNFIDPVDPTRQTAFLADLKTQGVEIDAVVRPTNWLSINVTGVFQDPTLNNLRLNGVPQTGFDGNRPERTPAKLYTITPTIQLPNGLGEVFARYKYVGKIFADSGNAVALPGYGVTGVGATLNVTERLQLSVNADNIFNVIGLTEGNPRQGQTQNADSGFFYARGIVGPTFGGTLTMRF
ncbi:TonB-dependent receptor [Sphingobium algorifonticola]|uniref:TonB-dependent receptor n=1 Tax=Sphingobium algorifonticola TaxID=2008318 RepID=A0A437JCG9_9SPHN|nr:TonB-dependent receptor [Sphingobium algorifonticola]RVT43581.1 TonB-dependent receptor [Sphingobium algorifonticola]